MSESQKFTEIMTAARKNLFVRYEVKFAGLMEKSGAELRAAEIECDAAYQKIYLKEFDAFLGEERGAGKISERALEQAHVHAAAVAVEYLGASGSIDDRNYARFLSTFKLAFVPKAPGIPPRSGVVAYRGGTGLLQPREESNSREI
ncbi:hypothetical protein D9O50_17155 [Oxalobacteraceae bacterium CAVE-383]|nr:hypothetical protein D9O50_17155 [Oxalobacteraceae bacterium CAVE-383]